MLDNEGKEVAGSAGYKYFGAARDLPGVRELFDAAPPPPAKKTRAELMKDIDSRYYGFLDDDDCRLVPAEVEAEREAVAKSVAEYKAKKEEGGGEVEEEQMEEDLYGAGRSAADRLEEAMQEGKEKRFSAHVVVPTQADIEAALLLRYFHLRRSHLPPNILRNVTIAILQEEARDGPDLRLGRVRRPG